MTRVSSGAHSYHAMSLTSASTALARHVAMRAKAIILVLAVAIVSGCFGTKRGPRGTNIGTGSDNDGPWSGGTTPAAVQQP